MKLAVRVPDLSDERLSFARQLGVTHLRILAGQFMDDDQRGPVQPDKLKPALERVKAHDLKIGVALLPQGRNSQHWNIRMGRPERDAEIEDVCRSLDTLGKAGVPVVEYVFNLQAGGGGYCGNHGGRGGARLTHFNYAKAKETPAPSPEEEATAEQIWERITYFLKRVIPVAEAAEMRLACHPNDPPVAYLRGEDRVLGSIEGLKTLMEIAPSPANGINFCVGTIAEMGVNVIEAIRYFGSRDKINMVHFRNVRGKVPVYDEVFVDEGDVDMVAAMRAFKEVGYNGTIMPDHTPGVAGDTPWGHRGRAFALGYIRALMQAVGVERD